MNIEAIRIGQELHDTLAAPLPGGVAAAVRFLFEVPQWIQIGGFFVGLIAAGALVTLLWKHRTGLIAWTRERTPLGKAFLLATVAGMATLGATFGFASWDYVEHENEFCVGCHVMNPAAGRFTES